MKLSFDRGRRRNATVHEPAPTVTCVHGGGGMAGANVRVHAPPPPEDALPEPVGDGDKPPYRVPSMREVEAVPWNGLTMASTFSGCGGSCLGFRMAGFRVAWASEFVEEARRTYLANHPHVILDDRDIREVLPEEILTPLGLARGELDVFEGSPPCASFSLAGKREKLWGKKKAYSGDKVQRTDDLFAEWVRLLDGLMPRAFVAENVAGMVVGTAKGHFLEALRGMRALGYRVGARVLDAQWLGVPQARRRVIFVGIREDLGLDPAFPKPLPFRYSIRDALPWLSSAEDARVVHDTSGLYGAGDVTDRPSPAITVGVNSLNARHFQVHGVPEPTEEELRETNFERYAIGAEWKKLKPGEGSDRYINLARSHPDRPSPTVTATAGQVAAAGVTHPSEPRKFTIPELRRICAFPDDFVLTGSYSQQWERMGRAVPPLMMRAVARELAAVLLRAKGGR